MGVKGVAFGLSLSVTVTCLALFEAWNKKSQNTEKSEVYLFLIKIILVSICIGIVLQAIYLGVIQILVPASLITNFAICIIMGLIFLILFGVTGKLFRIPEIHTLYEKLFRRLLPWQNKRT